MTARRGLLRAWTGSRHLDHARARDPGSPDALHLPRSQVTSVVRAPGRWASPPGRFYLRARSLACDLGANGASARRERKGGPRKVFSSQDRAYRRGLGFFLRSKIRRAALKAEFQGALAWTTAGARLLPLRAPARFASQRTQRSRKEHCVKHSGSALNCDGR
jgi:hypothetical protein